MSRQLLHTPEGVRDIYGGECEAKLSLQNRLLTCMGEFGYRTIETPTFEFLDVFSKEIGTISSRELYKFFDRDGNTLVLRPDITPSIARVCATIYADTAMPLRFCYAGNTFINHSSYQGRLKEVTQLGAELIGDNSAEADAEMTALIINCLKNAGLTEFQLSIGQMDFFKSLTEEANMDDETEQKLRELIINKNMFGVEEIVQEQSMRPGLKEIFLRLPELFGGPEIFSELRGMELSVHGREAIRRLEQIYSLLKVYGVESYVSFDLGMLGNYEYYTGVVFRAYTYGTGDYVVTGGRYNNLIAKFGVDKPAIGFAIVEDVLMSALERQEKDPAAVSQRVLFLYDAEMCEKAVRLASNFRESGRMITLTAKEPDKDIEDYRRYAKDEGMHHMIYLRSDSHAEMVDFVSGSEKELLLSSTDRKEES